MKMNINDDVAKVLVKIGLEEYEIDNVFSRNKYLTTLIDDDVLDVVKYLYTNCKMDMPDIKKLILKNPFVLNESFSRINALESIYKTVGIENEKYKVLINNFDKALSINPQNLADSINVLQKQGYDNEKIADLIIENPYLVIK
ncbi:MAG: hypothetical protein E7314_02085 [Clostridiales bacterium]|nr:hypothetical protein [Clostridiales bacterium]